MESEEIFGEVVHLRDEVDEQGMMLEALVRSSAAADSILEQLRGDEIAAAVLLAVDGLKTQTEILAHLNTHGIKTSAMTVTRRMELLSEDLGLIAFARHNHTGGKVYHRTRLCRALKISRELGKIK